MAEKPQASPDHLSYWCSSYPPFSIFHVSDQFQKCKQWQIAQSEAIFTVVSSRLHRQLHIECLQFSDLSGSAVMLQSADRTLASFPCFPWPASVEDPWFQSGFKSFLARSVCSKSDAEVKLYWSVHTDVGSESLYWVQLFSNKCKSMSGQTHIMNSRKVAQHCSND